MQCKLEHAMKKILINQGMSTHPGSIKGERKPPNTLLLYHTHSKSGMIILGILLMCGTGSGHRRQIRVWAITDFIE